MGSIPLPIVASHAIASLSPYLRRESVQDAATNLIFIDMCDLSGFSVLGVCLCSDSIRMFPLFDTFELIHANHIHRLIFFERASVNIGSYVGVSMLVALITLRLPRRSINLLAEEPALYCLNDGELI